MIARLGTEHRAEVVETLAQAFHDYPVMRYILGAPGTDYRAHLRHLVGFYCDTRFLRDWPVLGARQGDDLVAVAIINDPVPVPWPEELRTRYAALPELVGQEAVARMEGFESACDHMVPTRPHYFLGMLGVVPSHQGAGHAGRLLERLQEMSEADPRSEGVCLTTENPKNLGLYRRYGYEVIAEVRVGTVHSHCMFRPDSTAPTLA